MKKILILHIGSAIGGAEYSLLELICYMNKLSVDKHLIVTAQQISFYEKLKDLSFEIHDIGLSNLKLNKSVLLIIQQLILIVTSSVKLFFLAKKLRIGIIYCNTFKSLFYCLFIRLFSHIRIVCHCRDNVKSKAESSFLRYMADDVITVSTFIRKQLSSRLKVHVIYNGVDFTRFHTDNSPNWLHRKYNLSEKIQLIGNVGQILPWKNQESYISVAEYLLHKNKNIHFFLIGPIVDNRYYIKINQKIHSLGLEQYFTFTGNVDNIVDYLSEFSIILHTAIYEPFGRIVIEAGAFGKPVIAYDSGGPAEIIKNGETGYLLEAGYIGKIAELTEHLLGNSELQRRMGQAAQKHIIQKFSGNNYAKNVYQVLINA